MASQKKLDYQLVEQLIHNGADLNIQDNQGNIPLHSLALYGNIPPISQLVIASEISLINKR